MTPFTEVLDNMAAKLPEAGGVCINAESELEAIAKRRADAEKGVEAARETLRAYVAQLG